MYAAFSTTESETESLSESLSSSLKACLRFLSIGSCTWLLLSQVLSRSTVAFIEADSDLPEASLLMPPMTVARPMSCMAIDVGIPPLDRSFFSSLENALHSGPTSSIFSFTTNPQDPQNSSPPAVSSSMGPFPHLGHLSRAFCSRISLEESLSENIQFSLAKSLQETSMGPRIYALRSKPMNCNKLCDNFTPHSGKQQIFVVLLKKDF